MTDHHRPVVVMRSDWDWEDSRDAVAASIAAHRAGRSLPIHIVVDPDTGLPISQLTHNADTHKAHDAVEVDPTTLIRLRSDGEGWKP